MMSVARRQDDSGEYSDASHDNSGNDGGQQSDYDSQGSDSEHSNRDPESQESEKRVDDDEDRSNPQYIPKRGTFYEHDDRTAASGEESNNTTTETPSEKKEGSETPAERRRAPRKSETLNKWSHDKYNETEQIPKSRDELVAIYGYDIRNEDAPPLARRNRRYGRGPNKYTRTWEDEEAYKRQALQTAHKKPPSPSDFPELNAANKPGRKGRAPRPRSKSQPTSNDSSENGSQLRRNASIKAKSKPKPPAREKMPPLENLTITATINNNQNSQPVRKVNAVAQQRPVPTDLAKRKPAPTQPQSPHSNATPKQQPQTQQQQKPSQNQQTQQTASAGENRGGSKRYSSLRQRPLAEPYTPQQTQQQQPQQAQLPQQQQQQQQQQAPIPQQQQQNQQYRHHGEFVSGGNQTNAQHQGSPVPQMHPQQIIHQAQLRSAAVNQQPLAAPALRQPLPPPQQPQQQPLPQQPQQPHPQQQQVRLGMIEQQQMVPHTHHSIHNMPPPHNIGPLPAAQGYAPPAMMPAQYMQQSGSGAVFGGAMYQPPQYPPHQIYPHHNYGAQAGGVTYYTCAEQEQPPRAQRRPTAAIPIVRPAVPERAPNSTEKDNIDRIVENMFVRKPWPATHGNDTKDKEKSQEPQTKESSQPNSLTSSSISTDSKNEEKKEVQKEPSLPKDVPSQEEIPQKESQEVEEERRQSREEA